MVKIIDAIEMCENKSKLLRSEVEKMKSIVQMPPIVPTIVIINASDDQGNLRYIKNKVKEAEKIGIKPIVRKFDKNCRTSDVLRLINHCNDTRTPVILQLPIFNHLDQDLLLNAIDWRVDADGFTKEWIGLVNLGMDKNVAPATPKGVISLLEFHNIEIQGKNVLIIGSSNHVGKPLISMILNRGGTVLNANINTKDLPSLVRISDIVISCVGKVNLINTDDIKDDAVLIGVGFTYVEGKQILDFDINKIVEDGRASIVSNRINCTGKATVISLMENVVELYKKNYNIE